MLWHIPLSSLGKMWSKQMLQQKGYGPHGPQWGGGMYTHIVATDGEHLPNPQCAGTSYIAHTSKSETKIIAHRSKFVHIPSSKHPGSTWDIPGPLNARLVPKKLTQAAHEPAQASNLGLVAGAEPFKGLNVLAAHAQRMRGARPARAVHTKPVALHDGPPAE